MVKNNENFLLPTFACRPRRQHGVVGACRRASHRARDRAGFMVFFPGGGYLVYLFDGDVPFSGYRFRLFLLEQGIKEGKFSGAGSQKMSREESLSQQVII